MIRKTKDGLYLYDGKKNVDIWNGDEGWTIHSGEDSKADHEYIGLVPVLFRAVHQRARAIATMPFSLVTKGGADYDTSQDWKNKVDFLPKPSDLFYMCEASLIMAGRAYFMRRQNVAGYGKQPRYLLPSSVNLDEKKLPEIEFKRKVNNVDKTFTAKDIIYLWALDPSVEIGPARHFPAGVAAHACGVLYNVDEFAEAFFERGAIKSMLLTVQGNPPPGEKEKLEEWWKRMMAGIKNAWGSKVINADTVKPVVVGEGMKELENVTLTQEKKEDIATAFDLPYTILFASAANYATAVQDKRNWYEDSIIPECNFIASVLNEQVFDPMGLKLQFRPETLDIFQEDEAQRADALGKLVPVLSDPACEIALDILGYELDKDQWAALKVIWDAKKKASEAALERLNNPPAPAVQPGQPAQEAPAKPAEQQPPAPPPAKALTAAQIKDLDLWRQVATRNFKKGKGAADDFVCKALSAEIADPIREQLAQAESLEDIEIAFSINPQPIRVREDDPLFALVFELKRANDNLEKAPPEVKSSVPNITINNHIPKAPDTSVNVEPSPAPNVTVNLPAEKDVIVNIPDQKDIIINVEPTPVNIDNTVLVPEQAAPDVIVNVPERAEPIINVAAPIVNVAAPKVTVENNYTPDTTPINLTVKRDYNGKITGIEEK